MKKTLLLSLGLMLIGNLNAGAQALSTGILVSDTTGITMDMINTLDGGVVVCGFFEGSQDLDPGPGTAMVSTNGNWFDAWVAKYDSTGAFAWGYSWGSVSEDIANSLAADENGDIHVVGSFNGTIDLDPSAGVLNVTSTGIGSDLFWVKLNGTGTFITGGAITADGMAGITGRIDTDLNGHLYIGGWSNGNTDIDLGGGTTIVSASDPNTQFERNPSFIAKYDLNGSLIWGYPMGGFLKAIEVEPGGAHFYIATCGLEVVGTSTDYDPGPGQLHPLSAGMLGTEYMAILKYNSSAMPVWYEFIRGTQVGDPTSENVPYDLAIDGNLNVLMCGNFISDFTQYPGNVVSLDAVGTGWDGFALKFNSNGSLLWEKRFGASDVNDIARDLLIDANNNVWVAGTFQGLNAEMNSAGASVVYNSAGSRDIFVVSFGSGGNYLWSGTAGGSGYDGNPQLARNSNDLFLAGVFVSTADLDLSPVVTNYSEVGGAEVFLSRYSMSSVPTGLVTINDDEESIRLFPNPASEITHFSSKTFVKVIEVLDAVGHRISTSFHNNSIDVSQWPNGTYIVRFSNGHTKCLIVNNK